jgi:4-amino-4-deoxy-L-arabinose transferase-like glycosyltransferase
MVSDGAAASPRRDLTPLAVAVVPLAVALVVIAATWGLVMPGVGFWDTAEFQTVPPILGTAHPTGYPTYVILGWLANVILAPFGEPAFRMNLFSLIAVAVAAAATTDLVRTLTRSTPIAIAAGLGLAATPVVWRIATHADPHALHLAFVALILALLVRWERARAAGGPRADRWLVAAAVAFGLSVGNHSLTLLLAVPIGLYVIAVHPRIVLDPRLIAVCTLALVVTIVAVYLELPLRAGPFRAPLVYADPSTWQGFWYIALAEQFRGSLVDPLGDLPRKAGDVIRIAGAQLGPLVPLVGVGFLATVARAPRYALLSGLAMLITVVFNASYVTADIERYSLGPVLWAWTWVAALGGVIVEQVVLAGGAAGEEPAEGEPEATTADDRASTGWLATAVAFVLAVAILSPTILDLGPRRAATDRHTDAAGERWLATTLPALERDAVVVSWWSASTTLWYAQYVDGLRTDLFVVDDRTRLDQGLGEATDVIAKFLGKRPVYVIRANARDLGLVQALYDIAPVQATLSGPMVVWKVAGVRGAAS